MSLRNALNTSALEGELRPHQAQPSGTLGFARTSSPKARPCCRHTHGREGRGVEIPVLVAGKSGVGKELIARAIHGSGDRRLDRSSRSIAARCRKTWSKSILFGHEKGSFTGATERHVGKFVEASGGTLFLDEVGELPPAAQVKLLRAIQESEVEPVGARKPVKVDVRIISATNRDLIADVKQGRFREDLFYRLHVFPITVPPLRQRPADIPALARHFLALFAAEEGKRIRAITPDALQLLSAFRWPGNIRQLENAVFRAVVLADDDCIGIDEFPQISAQISAPVISSGHAEPVDELTERSLEVIAAAQPLALQPAMPALPAVDALPLLDAQGDVRPLEELEAELIDMRSAIIAARCRKSRAGCRSDVRPSTASWRSSD